MTLVASACTQNLFVQNENEILSRKVNLKGRILLNLPNLLNSGNGRLPKKTEILKLKNYEF